jgi:hypothetical protein
VRSVGTRVKSSAVGCICTVHRMWVDASLGERDRDTWVPIIILNRVGGLLETGKWLAGRFDGWMYSCVAVYMSTK